MIMVTIVSERSRKWGLWKMARDLEQNILILIFQPIYLKGYLRKLMVSLLHLVSMKARIMLTSSLAEQ